MKTIILVVDDDQDFARMLGERLDLRGYDTAVVFDGLVALEWLQTHPCDIVLLDLGLPGMGGIDVLPRIKQAFPFIQVIIITGATETDTAIAGMKLGATDYLIKPVAFETLLEAIHNAQARRNAQEESQRMVETSKMAALGVLAEGVAHEIINPVNVMLNAAGWVEDLVKDEENLSKGARTELLETLDKIRGHGKRCKDIIAKLLAFGGRIDPTPRAVQLNDFLAGLLARFKDRSQALGVEVKTDFGEGLPIFYVSPAELQVAMQCIIDNSLEAMEQKGGTLLVRTFVDERFGMIEVADTGRGIPKAKLGRIFEPFFSTKEVGKGSGLGLAICYSMVTGMGGDIRVDSIEGEGTKVLIRIPLACPWDGGRQTNEGKRADA